MSNFKKIAIIFSILAFCYFSFSIAFAQNIATTSGSFYYPSAYYTTTSYKETTATGGMVAQQELEIVRIKKETRFIYPASGSIVKGDVVIEVHAERTTAVELFIKRADSLTSVYLGKCYYSGMMAWRYNWNTIHFPNGAYKLYAEVTSDFGKYFGGEINIEVANNTQENTTQREEITTKVEVITQTIKEDEKIIENQIVEIIAEIATGTASTIKEISGQVETVVDMVQEEQALKEIIKQTENSQTHLEEIIRATEKEVSIFIPEVIDFLKTEKQTILEDYQGEKEILSNSIELFHEELRQTGVEKEALKQKIIETVSGKEETAQKIRKGLQKLEESVSGAERDRLEKMQELLKDSDSDNVSDVEEVRLGTNPLDPDTDDDGFLDGTEMSLGFNPLNPSPADKISYEDPRKIKPEKTEIYKVERVEAVKSLGGEGALKIQGKGLPNSFITLYVFSLPTVVMVKTDNEGNWEYVLDKDLADGQHTVYAAVTDNNGSVEARSETFVFMKTGDKVFRIFDSPQTDTISPADILQKKFAAIMSMVIFLSIGLALFLIGLSTKKIVKL